jgi:protease-4
MGKTEDEEPHFTDFGDYVSQVAVTNLSSKNKIALIYAEGEIVSGSGAQGEVGSASMVEKIKKAREDEATKAVVLRINSPGGSALASEVMWRELELLKAEKPLIVSMGDLAASGGYYIAAPADAIYADRSTLTGSIGVFGLLANVGDALKSKLGVTTDVVKTGRYADLGSMYRSPAPAELAFLQTMIEDTYSTFVGHVADGRNMTPEAVDAIGQGRVWAGADALEIGLIDGYGGLVDALSLAADRVGIVDDFRIWEVMDAPSPFDAIFSGLGASVRSWALKDELGEAFRHYEYLRGILDEPGVQARMPYVVEIQ